MAEIAEGFSINATIILDAIGLSYIIGDIKHPKVNLSQVEMPIGAALTLDATDILNILGDIKRSNTGSQGFTIKAAAILDDKDNTFNIGDISHGKCVIRDDDNTTSAFMKLDNNDLSLYLGDFLRSNSGSQGFTVKSVLELDDKDNTDYFADISHGKCIIRDDEKYISSSLILDEECLDEFLGDFCRQNKGQEGFTIYSKAILDTSDKTDIVADIFRKNEPKYNATTKILAYKDKYYLVYANGRVYHFLTKTGDG